MVSQSHNVGSESPTLPLSDRRLSETQERGVAVEIGGSAFAELSVDLPSATETHSGPMAYAEYDKSTYVPYERPKQLGAWESLRLTLWNPEKHAVLDRTFSSWVKILTFYLIFYICLAALWTICCQVLLLTISDQHPSYILDESLIGSNPGVGFRPISDNPDVDGSLIIYQANDEEQSNRWVNRIEEFLEPYRQVAVGGQNLVICDFNSLPPPGKVCNVLIDKEFGDCSAEFGYGYNKSSPCIFLKLNRIYGWKPEFYQTNELPEEMPEDLVSTIQNAANKDFIWISCQGENPYDRENIGPINYFPAGKRGFPGYYYPYENSRGYLSPLVAIQLVRPKKNVLINVECRAWAKNIKYGNTKGVREGSVHFEVLID